MAKMLLFQALLMTCIIIHGKSVIQNQEQLETLLKERVIPEFAPTFQSRHHNEFAVVLLFPDTNWQNFQYDPSKDNGMHPVDYQGNPLFPITPFTFGNYLAAGLGSMNEHSEDFILSNIDTLYNAYQQKYEHAPQALVLYS